MHGSALMSATRLTKSQFDPGKPVTSCLPLVGFTHCTCFGVGPFPSAEYCCEHTLLWQGSSSLPRAMCMMENGKAMSWMGEVRTRQLPFAGEHCMMVAFGVCTLYSCLTKNNNRNVCLCVWHAQWKVYKIVMLMPWVEAGTLAFAKTGGKGNMYEGEFCDGVFDGQGANGQRHYLVW